MYTYKTPAITHGSGVLSIMILIGLRTELSNPHIDYNYGKFPDMHAHAVIKGVKSIEA